MAERNEFSSFDENAWKAQDAADDQEIARLLEQSQEGDANNSFKIDDTPFDQSNKADDAQDYEDISDDDLPEEEPSAGNSLEMPALTDDGGTSNDADDLFGEGPSSPTDPIVGPPSPATRVRDTDTGDESQPIDAGMSFGAINFDPDPHMNGAANQDPDIPAAAETMEDLLKAAWPAFQKGRVLTWSELLPPKQATWKEKRPSKKPKHLVTSKLNLDFAADEEKHFRIPGDGASSGKKNARDTSSSELVRCNLDAGTEKDDTLHFELDQESDSETVVGFTLRDIELACDDFAARIQSIERDEKRRLAAEKELLSRKRQVEEQDDEWDAEFLMDTGDEPKRPKKRRAVVIGLPEIHRYAAPNFDNFEDATRRGSKRVHLDMNDPQLLLETDMHLHNKRLRLDSKAKRMANGRIGRETFQRFNISNDEAYDLLKENHQSKVRATLGNISVEHSMPAIKLSWPYYRVKLGGTTDEYHRPRFRYKKFVGYPIRFDKPQHHKRKLMKGKAHEVYRQSQDLSLCDNSTAVLFEYCEPRPRVLNNFGMGSKLINYYRRKDNNEDEHLPKQDLGEYRTLLPEDRSPFSLFGTVDSGETVPTLHNEMYRAPVFKHTPRDTDFLIVRSTTGLEGSKWHLHKIDHLHVVGQAFPSVEVPGPHSRKVTNASKNRMKMLSFRMIRHSRTDNCQLSDITKHIAESTDTQNRQKLKEFLQYDRESGEKGMWRLKPGEVLPDENAIRAMIKPEEVSLLDAMQLGIKELEDAGYDPRNANIDEDVMDIDAADEDDDEEGSKAPKGAKKAAEKQEETLADKMAPWKTTKAFIDACAQKAMLQLHGEGDPTGHGLGFSFIRTSMKGGYIEAVQGPLATSADAMEREKRANGGHAYNVKKQQAMYEEGIKEIWDKQKATLSDPQGHDDKDIAVTEDEDDRFNTAATPAQFDEGMSQISGLTSASRQNKKAIRITREVRMPDGSTQARIEVVHDPVVISQYMKRRTEADLEIKEYVDRTLRRVHMSGPQPRTWKRLPFPVKALHKWAGLARLYPQTTKSILPVPPGSVADAIGLEFRAPAYIYLSTASTARDLRVMPTMIALQALESKRNWNDWKRTRPDDKLASSRKNCITRPALASLGLLEASTRFPLAQLANVPTVAKSATSRPIRSMEPPLLSPPPRVCFDWWSVPTEVEEERVAALSEAQRRRNEYRVKRTALRRVMKTADSQSKAREKQRQALERVAARKAKKAEREDAKAQERAQEQRKRESDRLERERKKQTLADEAAQRRAERQQEKLERERRKKAQDKDKQRAKRHREKKRLRQLARQERKKAEREAKARARPKYSYGHCRV